MLPWAHPIPHPKRHLDRSSVVFAHLRAEASYTLQWAALSRQNCPFAWPHGGGPSYMVLGPTRVHKLNGILIGSAVFAGLTIVTNRPTDRETNHSTPSATIGRICVVLRCGLIIIGYTTVDDYSLWHYCASLRQ